MKSKGSHIFLSVVIPAYNEEKIIKKNLRKIMTYLDKKKYTWQIVAVDDGSRDKTSKQVKKIKTKRIKLITFEKNQGKGAALKKGFEEATGEYIIFMDSDLSVPLNHIDNLLGYFQKGYEVVIGSRRVEGSKIEVHQPIMRESMGRVFTYLTRKIAGVNLRDFTCGFKGFTREAGKRIFGLSRVKRWSYDAEILFLANKFGYQIKEVPVSWKNRPESRVVLGVDTFTSFRDLLVVRLNYILGKYNEDN
jgi:dolichyl-phosphate beta-glucosyltransferase